MLLHINHLINAHQYAVQVLGNVQSSVSGCYREWKHRDAGETGMSTLLPNPKSVGSAAPVWSYSEQSLPLPFKETLHMLLSESYRVAVMMIAD